MTLAANSDNTFTAPANTTLESETDYFLVFIQPSNTGGSARKYEIATTEADAEDAGAASGWSITDDEHYTKSTPSSPGQQPARYCRSRSRVSPRTTPPTLRSSATRARPTIVTGRSTLTTMHRNSPPAPPARATRLRSVGVVILGTTPNVANITGSINEINADDEPGTSLGTLGAPTNSGDVYTFSNTTGIDLAASTSYFVMLDVTGSASGNLSNAVSGDQTSSYGWTIADGSIYRNRATSGSWTDYGSPKRILIIGAVKGNTAGDATLSALTLVDGDGNAITLDPTFVSSTTDYQARVDNDVDEVTLTATKNASAATVVITDDDNTSTAGEADLDLDEGVNTLEVTVTSEDTNNTETYTIVLVRETSAPTADPDAIWTANLTVGIGEDSVGGVLIGLSVLIGETGWGAIAPREFDYDDKTIGVRTLQYDSANQLGFDYASGDPGAVEALGANDLILHVRKQIIRYCSPRRLKYFHFPKRRPYLDLRADRPGQAGAGAHRRVRPTHNHRRGSGGQDADGDAGHHRR